MEEQKRRAWAEVSLKNLAHNYHALREQIPQNCKFMGMVKSDAYGHGALPVSRELQRLGADYLGVACLDEALELRQGGITLPILILGTTAVEDVPQLLKHKLTQTVFDLETAKAHSTVAEAAGEQLAIHIKVDTGMSRLGFFCQEESPQPLADELEKIAALSGLKLEGIFTHFADADGSEENTLKQFAAFLALLDKLEKKGINIPIRHCANSAATLKYPFSHLDMVRPGISLYGHYPGADMEDLCPLLPVLELRARLSSVKPLPKGAAISYGGTHTLERDSRVAVISLGYGDGFHRSLSNQFSVEISGKTAPILGRICMDMCMVDVTDIDAASPGQEAVVYSRQPGSGQSVDAAADKIGTISYELLCALTKRIPRIYG